MNKKDFAEELGKRIREAREKAGLTQTVLGELVKKEQRTISEYEAGTRNMYAADIPIFAEALNVSVGFLILGLKIDPELTQTIVAEFEALPEGGMRKIAVDLVRVLSSHRNDSE